MLTPYKRSGGLKLLTFKLETMIENSTEHQDSTNPPLLIASVSCSTDKLIFLYQAIKNRKEIAAHIFNDVFCEFEDTFYKGGSYKNAMANFKRYMKLAAENKGHRVIVLPARNNGILHGIKNLWSVEYCNYRATAMSSGALKGNNFQNTINNDRSTNIRKTTGCTITYS